MRSKNEKKTIVKSIKISPVQEKIIKGRADELGMNFSEYMVNCAVHRNHEVTPDMAVKLQEMINIVKDIACTLDYDDYRRKSLLYKADNFNVSENKKLKDFDYDIEKLIEGGEDIWEFLK